LSKQAKEPLGLLIATARRRIKQVAAARAAQHGVTPLQFWLLVGLVEGGSQSLASWPSAAASTTRWRRAAFRPWWPPPWWPPETMRMTAAGPAWSSRPAAAPWRAPGRRGQRHPRPGRARSHAKEGEVARTALRKVIANLEKAS